LAAVVEVAAAAIVVGDCNKFEMPFKLVVRFNLSKPPFFLENDTTRLEAAV